MTDAILTPAERAAIEPLMREVYEVAPHQCDCPEPCTWYERVELHAALLMAETEIRVWSKGATTYMVTPDRVSELREALK